MTKVLLDQLTVVGQEAPARGREYPQTGPGRSKSEDVELILLELTQRAPAPAVGPSHWWG
jgi:hypothetical protein